ncbi:receptor-like protein EIX2 [Ipomoea triloba]|uniref:receptor-like protein EIX2 n=1 Tax=Ipomoea triloba TaxID=35885 RepID=UPI00125DBD9B|nr:receptor-like protein EIX2 [Ipomoea triloba]
MGRVSEAVQRHPGGLDVLRRKLQILLELVDHGAAAGVDAEVRNNNKFEGGLPSSLQNLGSLITLDLSENGLMDVIHPWIGENLPSLRFLNIQKNKFFGDISFQLCYLKVLQLLNLANNNISGPIPRCFNNFTAMVNDSSRIFLTNHEENIYEDIKGLELEYTTNLEFLKFIDLSGNHITGEIPLEVMSLRALNNLNLSRNNLSGTISQTIGNLSKIEYLNLSMNALFCPIPQSLSSLNFLSYLNLSFNKLNGRIPTGHQLQTLDDLSIYIGNEGLCGVPLLKSCPSDDKPSFVKQPTETKLSNDDNEFLMWFYAGLGLGFFVGFIGVLCTLLFKTSWHYAYFKCLEITFNKVLSGISIKRNRWVWLQLLFQQLLYYWPEHEYAFLLLTQGNTFSKHWRLSADRVGDIVGIKYFPGDSYM